MRLRARGCRAAAAAVFALSAALASPAIAAERSAKPLKIALPSLPDARGNPFISTVPPFTMVIWSIFDPLTQVDLSQPGGAVLPWLASAWEPIDALRWRVKLREDVRFSNGVPLTADAVVGTLAFVKNQAAAHFGVASEMIFVESARAEDAHTVIFTLSRPDPLFPRLLSMLPIVEHTSLERLGIEAFSLAPVGTGPYVAERFETTRVLLRANPNAWKPAPTEAVEMIALGDSAARMQALVSRAVDLSMTIEPEDAPRVEAIGGRTYLSPINSVLLLLLRQTGEADSPLKNRLVRRALNHAVNRTAIAEAILGGAVVPAGQLASPNTLGYDPSLVPAAYDPALAKRLLAEAGYPNGFTFTAKVIVGGIMGDAATYQQVAIDLAAIGVTMKLETVPPANLARDLRSGEWSSEAMVNSYSADPLLDSLRAMRFNSCLNPATWVCDRTIQPVIDAAFAAEDLATRETLTRQVIRHYREEEYALLLHSTARLSALGPRVQSFEAGGSRIRWDRVVIKDGK
jgi:peptide/nickel transport system substrate-binding protein